MRAVTVAATNHIPANGAKMTSCFRRSCIAPTTIPSPPISPAVITGTFGFISRGDVTEIAKMPAILSITQPHLPPISGKGWARLIHNSMIEVPPRKATQLHMNQCATVTVFNSFQTDRWVRHHRHAIQVARILHCLTRPTNLLHLRALDGKTSFQVPPRVLF